MGFFSFLRQCLDNFAQISQAQIDFLSLLKDLTFSPRLRYLLRPGKVNQKQFARFGAIIQIIALINRQQKDEMWPGRMLIHISRTGNSIFLSVGDNSKQLMFVAYIYFSQILHIYSLLILSDFKIIFTNIQEISYFLHV